MTRDYLSVIGVFAAGCGLLLSGEVPLRVRNVRLTAAPHLDGAPSTFLRFGLSNEGAGDVTQVAVKISILRESADSGMGERLAGRYIVTSERVILHAGETLDFTIRLRNLSSQCGCVARVTVLSADLERGGGAVPDDVPARSPAGSESGPTSLIRTTL